MLKFPADTGGGMKNTAANSDKMSWLNLFSVIFILGINQRKEVIANKTILLPTISHTSGE